MMTIVQTIPYELNAMLCDGMLESGVCNFVSSFLLDGSRNKYVFSPCGDVNTIRCEYCLTLDYVLKFHL